MKPITLTLSWSSFEGSEWFIQSFSKDSWSQNDISFVIENYLNNTNLSAKNMMKKWMIEGHQKHYCKIYPTCKSDDKELEINAGRYLDMIEK